MKVQPRRTSPWATLTRSTVATPKLQTRTVEPLRLKTRSATTQTSSVPKRWSLRVAPRRPCHCSTASPNATKQSVNNFDYRLVGGLDSTIFFHLDWRVVEFSYGGGVTEATRKVHTTNLSTGLVLRF